MLFEIKIDDFPLQSRAINILRKAGFEKESDFQNVSEKQIKELPGFGAQSLVELKVFLKARKIKLVKEKKEKAAPKYHPQSKELVLRLLQKGEINFSREIPAADKLICAYGFEQMARIKMPNNVNSLIYFIGGIGGWADRYISGFQPVKLVEKEVVEHKKEEVAPAEYKKVERPMDLKDFLGLRK